MPGMMGEMQPSLAGKRYFYCKPVKDRLHHELHHAGISSDASQGSRLCLQHVAAVPAPATATARSVSGAEALGLHGSSSWR